MEFACAHFGGPRYGMDVVLHCHETILGSGSSLLDGIAAPVVMLNEHWQVVYSNRAFNAFAKVHEPSTVLGLRLGEILGCGNAVESLSGCGTSTHCPACGFFQTFYVAREHGAPMRFSGNGSGSGADLLDGSVGICRQVRFDGYDLRVCTLIPPFWL